jgi:GNAT superfamily N-acetyltransferase
MRLTARIADDLPAGAELVTPLLAARPFEHHVFATALGRVRADPVAGAAATLAWAEGEDGVVVGAALDAPPHPLVVSALVADAAEPLARALAERGVAPPGIAGPEPAATDMAEAWAARTRRPVRRTMAQLVMVLGRLAPPAAPPGRPRLAEAADRALLERWLRAFGADVGLPVVDPAVAVEARMRSRQMLVWEDGGPACLVGWSPFTLDIVRIAPVYTPPERRGRGYATAAVAAASARLLAEEPEAVMLLADRDDPRANRVYARVGYRPVAEAGYHLVA